MSTPDLSHTSIPRWALDVPGGDGTSDDAVAVKFSGADAGSHVRFRTAEQAREYVTAVLSDAVVGTRLHARGPLRACLTIRAAALTAGMEEDEIELEPSGRGPIDVFCSHCREVTTDTVAVGDNAQCSGCNRTLVVYHHVSRRTGHFLGFMADAETLQEQS